MNGLDFQQLVEECRDFQSRVPFFENLIGSTWEVTGPGKASTIDLATGKEHVSVDGPGTITLSTYWSQFETAVAALERAISNASYADLQSAVVSGIASIEAYINHRAELWNRTNPDDQLLDTKAQKVSFEDKIDKWIPKMTGGKKHDKSIRNWADFKLLHQIRDNVTIHSKSSSHGTSYQGLANTINRFKTGIAGLLVQLHLLFNEKIPAIIVRNYYAPDVEISQGE